MDSDYDEDDDENDEAEDVEDVEGEDDDDDGWLNEGLEGVDFGDDVFAAQNSTPQGSTPNTAQNQAMHPTQPQNQAMQSMQTLSGLSQPLRMTW